MGLPRGATAASGVTEEQRQALSGACVDANAALLWLMQTIRRVNDASPMDETALASSAPSFPDMGIVNGGVSQHMCADRRDFTSYSPPEHSFLLVASTVWLLVAGSWRLVDSRCPGLRG